MAYSLMQSLSHGNRYAGDRLTLDIEKPTYPTATYTTTAAGALLVKWPFTLPTGYAASDPNQPETPS